MRSIGVIVWLLAMLIEAPAEPVGPKQVKTGVIRLPNGPMLYDSSTLSPNAEMPVVKSQPAIAPERLNGLTRFYFSALNQPCWPAPCQELRPPLPAVSLNGLVDWVTTLPLSATPDAWSTQPGPVYRGKHYGYGIEAR